MKMLKHLRDSFAIQIQPLINHGTSKTIKSEVIACQTRH